MRLFAQMRLGAKLTVLLAVFMLVPLLAGSALLLVRLHAGEVGDAAAQNDAQLRESSENVALRADRCLAAMDALVAWLETAWPGASGDTAAFATAAEEMLAYVQSLNTDLFSVRLYLYSLPRQGGWQYLATRRDMELRPWATAPPPTGRKWNYNQRPAYGGEPGGQAQAVLVGDVRDAADTPIGMVEISLPMALLFAEMHRLPADSWMGFMDTGGNLHYDREGLMEDWWGFTGSLVHEVTGSFRDYVGNRVEISGSHFWVAGIPQPSLSGSLISAVSLNDILRQQARFILAYSLAGLLLAGLCVALLNKAVGRVLLRFHRLADIWAELRRGNLTVEVPAMGLDEVGLLADDLRVTVQRFQHLLAQNVERELLVQTTEVRALQTQINSHFIYNVLESIKMMAEIKEEYQISDAVTSLGSLLRYSMKWPSSMVSLGEELEYIQSYVVLINLRYDYTISLAMQVPDELLAQKIPKMSLQPIVENAIYHGIEGLREDAVINLRVRRSGGDFEVEIVDSGKGMNEAALAALRRQVYSRPGPDAPGRRKGGIGLHNVQNRIRLSFGSQYGLTFEAEENRYMKVTVKLPVAPGGSGDG